MPGLHKLLEAAGLDLHRVMADRQDREFVVSAPGGIRLPARLRFLPNDRHFCPRHHRTGRIDDSSANRSGRLPEDSNAKGQKKRKDSHCSSLLLEVLKIS
jgi:hypothetical protein